MGIFDSITKAFYKVADPIITAVARPVDTVKAILSPTKTVKEVSNEFFSQSKTKQAAEYAINAALIGGSALSVAKSGVTAVAKSIIPSSTKGKVVAALATPVIVGAAIKAPEKVFQAPAKAGAELVEFGEGIGTVVAKPSVSAVVDLVKQSPVISAGVVAAAAAPLIAPAVKGLIVGEAIGDVEEAIREQPLAPVTAAAPVSTVLPAAGAEQSQVLENPSIPILATDKKTTTKRRYKKRKPVPPVKITNRNINKLVAVIK